MLQQIKTAVRRERGRLLDDALGAVALTVLLLAVLFLPALP